MKHVLTIIGGEDGNSLAEIVSQRLRLSREEAARSIAEGRVYLDRQRQQNPKLKLRAGQQLVVHARPPRTSVAAPLLVYRDREIAVLDKPSGMPSEPTRTGGVRSVVDFLREELDSRARLLHRLDTEASGLLLVSLVAASRKFFAAQVSEHRLLRTYFAIVAGAPPAELELSGKLAVHRGRARPSSDRRARGAQTKVWSLRQTPAGHWLVQVQLQTGRTHQIRAQLAARELPLLGDDRYDGPAAPRLALHAHCLGVALPAGGWIELHSPLPAALRALL